MFSKEVGFWAQSWKEPFEVLYSVFLFYWSSASTVSFVIVLIQNLDKCWKIITLIADLLLSLRPQQMHRPAYSEITFRSDLKEQRSQPGRKAELRHTEYACYSQRWHNIRSECEIHHWAFYFVLYIASWDWDQKVIDVISCWYFSASFWSLGFKILKQVSCLNVVASKLVAWQICAL